MARFLPRHPGWSWEPGSREVRAFTGPGGAATHPGWTSWLWARASGASASSDFITGIGGSFTAATPLLAMVGVGVFIIGQYNHGWQLPALPIHWAWLALAAEAALLLARAIDRGRAALPGLPTGTVAWEPGEELRVEAAFGGGGDAVAARDAAAVVWSPLRWYGWWSRVPLALGAAVRVDRVAGPPLAVARGLDPQGLRNLAERLARDLGCAMVEEGPVPLRREPGELDRPLVRGPIRAASAFRVGHSSWTHGASDGGWRAAMPRRLHLHTVLAIAFSAENLLLPPLLAFEAVRFGVSVATHGPAGVLLHVVAKPPAELVLLTLVAGDYARQVWDASQPHEVRIEGGKLRAAGGWLPVRRIEQVRAESFPGPAVRVIADGRELVIADLPTQIDADALAELLPEALAAASEEARPAQG